METRGIITIEGKAVVLPNAEVWMTTVEIASLFYVRGVTVEAAIRKLRKERTASRTAVHAGAYGYRKQKVIRRFTAWKRS